MKFAPVEDMAELFAPGIKEVMAENRRLQRELELAQARNEELRFIVDKIGTALDRK